MIPELENAIIEIERSILMLRQSSYDRWAAELELLLASVTTIDRYVQKEALFQVGQFCHPKALGDTYVTATDWPTQLERLHDTCATAFNKLERGE